MGWITKEVAFIDDSLKICFVKCKCLYTAILPGTCVHLAQCYVPVVLVWPLSTTWKTSVECPCGMTSLECWDCQQPPCRRQSQWPAHSCWRPANSSSKLQRRQHCRCSILPLLSLSSRVRLAVVTVIVFLHLFFPLLTFLSLYSLLKCQKWT